MASSAYSDVQSLYGKLAAPEQQKLQAHLDALSDLKKGFAATSLMGTNCAVPAKPSSSSFPPLLRYQGGEPYFDAITKAHISLLAQAFACDITRFATLFMADLSYAANPLMLPTDNHGSVAHPYDGSPVGSDGQPVVPGTNASATWALLAKFNKYCYGNIATLMKQLDAMGVLDNTLIYASSDMGNPARHSTRNVPTILAGGANGLITMGRRLKMTPDCPEHQPVVRPDRRRLADRLHADHQQPPAGVDRQHVRRRGEHLRDAAEQVGRHRPAAGPVARSGLRGRQSAQTRILPQLCSPTTSVFPSGENTAAVGRWL